MCVFGVSIAEFERSALRIHDGHSGRRCSGGLILKSKTTPGAETHFSSGTTFWAEVHFVLLLFLFFRINESLTSRPILGLDINAALIGLHAWVFCTPIGAAPIEFRPTFRVNVCFTYRASRAKVSIDGPCAIAAVC